MLACCEGMVTAVTLAACEATPQHIKMLPVCEASGSQLDLEINFKATHSQHTLGHDAARGRSHAADAP